MFCFRLPSDAKLVSKNHVESLLSSFSRLWFNSSAVAAIPWLYLNCNRLSRPSLFSLTFKVKQNRFHKSQQLAFSRSLPTIPQRPSESFSFFSTFLLDLWVNWTREANSTLTIASELSFVVFLATNRTKTRKLVCLFFSPFDALLLYDNEGVCNAVKSLVVFNYNPFFCLVQRFRTSATFYDYYK